MSSQSMPDTGPTSCALWRILVIVAVAAVLWLVFVTAARLGGQTIYQVWPSDFAERVSTVGTFTDPAKEAEPPDEDQQRP